MAVANSAWPSQTRRGRRRPAHRPRLAARRPRLAVVVLPVVLAWPS